mmetsp:Transcript_5721/g.14490  ORF Transcript_5721/g.14490 Transcript_5721/m.14490 type:complete len:231 (-) Transcript_5721:1190-1882(-)
MSDMWSFNSSENSCASTCPDPSTSKELTTASSCASDSTARLGSCRRMATRNSSVEMPPLPSVSISSNALARSPPDCSTAAVILVTTSSCHSRQPPFSSTVNFSSHGTYLTPSHEVSMSSGLMSPDTSLFHAMRTCSTCARPCAHSKKDTAPVCCLSARRKYSSSAALCSMMYSVACCTAALRRISLPLRLDTTTCDMDGSFMGSHWNVSDGRSSPCLNTSTAPKLPEVPQ